MKENESYSTYFGKISTIVISHIYQFRILPQIL